jgi:hypothetical protein
MEKVKADKESIQLNAIDKALNELEPSVSKKKGSKFLLSSPTTLDNDLNTLDEPLSKTFVPTLAPNPRHRCGTTK